MKMGVGQRDPIQFMIRIFQEVLPIPLAGPRAESMTARGKSERMGPLLCGQLRHPKEMKSQEVPSSSQTGWHGEDGSLQRRIGT